MSVVGVVVCSVFIALGLAGLVGVRREQRRGQLEKPGRSYLGVALYILFFALLLVLALDGGNRGYSGGSVGGG